MKLEYLSTLDEVIETQMLWLRDLKTVTKWRLWGVFYWFVIAALFFGFATGQTINKIVFGTVFGGLLSGNLVFNAENVLRRKLKKILLKKAGTFEPAPATVIFSGSQIEFSSRGTTTVFNLNKIKSFENIRNGLVLNSREGNLLYLPNNAFNDNNERVTWLNAINEILSNV